MSLAEQVNKHQVRDREHVLRLQISQDIFARMQSGQAEGEIKEQITKLYNPDNDTLNTIFAEAKTRFENVKETFWAVTIVGKSKKIELIRPKLITWLEGIGIYRYYIDSKQYIYIQIKDKVVTEIQPEQIKHLIFAYLDTLPDKFDTITRDQLKQFIMKGSGSYFSKDTYDYLADVTTVLPFKWNRDTKTHHFQYYENCVVITDASAHKVIPFKKLYNYIWQSQIIKRKFKLVETTQDCEYSRFLFNICGQDADKYLSLCTIIGYLLHQFKDSSYCPAIILNDEIINDNPSGGTGKGLFFKALKQLINIVIIDGKNFHFDKNFAFQRVNLDTQLILIEDVEKGFNMEKLFSIVTEGLAVEKKGKDEYYIIFAFSPKIGITTNYAVNGDGASHERRRVDVELTQYYNMTHRPVDDFGHMLFDGWSDEEWLLFDNFMLNCVQGYFLAGVKPYALVNLKSKKFKNSVGVDFYEYMSQEVREGEYYDRRSLYNAYITYSGSEAKLHSFTRWVKKYSEYSGVKVTDNRHSGQIYFGELPMEETSQEQTEIKF